MLILPAGGFFSATASSVSIGKSNCECAALIYFALYANSSAHRLYIVSDQIKPNTLTVFIVMKGLTEPKNFAFHFVDIHSQSVIRKRN